MGGPFRLIASTNVSSENPPRHRVLDCERAEWNLLNLLRLAKCGECRLLLLSGQPR
jgi:hypothetical protein